MIGKTLGHYRVGEQLGRGGMGEVYVADDLNLNRKVALKFLPEAFTGDPERMARFEREAKLLASLNHPNIAAIYGLEQAEGKRFLVLELVEGETLAQRLSKGALSVDESLEICRQIAEGLEAAHEKGVIHRDLKPANVMITEGDKIKILDFGLAKALSDETQSVDSSQSPTLTEAMTRPGVILGTAAYMSPEQAKGKAVDKRADIWAFGCILYECLAGKRAFAGETVTETLASVLKNEPDWQALPTTTPPNIRFVMRRCLEKDTNRRFRDAADVRIQIENGHEVSAKTATVRRPWLAWTWAAIATLLVIALAVPAFLYFRGRETPDAMLFHEAVPPMSEYAISISPDGRAIAYVAPSAGINSLFIRKIGSGAPRKIDGTEGAEYPFWSPDGRFVAFGTRDSLKRIDISGGSPRDICQVSWMSGGTWNSDGIIVFCDSTILKRVSAEGGEPSAITTLDTSQGEDSHWLPSFLPDGRHFIYSIGFGSESKDGIYWGSIDSKEKKRLLTANSMAIYAEPGYLLFQRGKTLFARPFDAKSLTLGGEEVGIANGLLPYSFYYGTAMFSASQNGALVCRLGEAQAESRFSWFDRTGKPLGSAGEPGSYMADFDLSHDGKQIAVAQRNPATNSLDIQLIEWERNVTTRLTFDKALGSDVIWSPDGRLVAYCSSRKGNADIFEKKANGIGEETLVLESSGIKWPLDWSNDGRYIVYGYDSPDAGGGQDLFFLPLFGDRKPLPIVRSPGNQDRASFSFDGKWLAYGSNESGTWQVNVVSFPAADRKRQISTSGGAQPRWRGDGKELYYLSLDGKMMAVDIRTETEVQPSIPRVLFNTELIVEPYGGQYDVTSDGRRFLLLKPLMETALTPITIILNWTSLLKK